MRAEARSPKNMGGYAKLLRQGASEARRYRQNSPDARFFEVEHLDSLANWMETASSMTDPAATEFEILKISHSLGDRGNDGARAPTARADQNLKLENSRQELGP